VIRPGLIYLLGIVPFSFFYYALKQRLGPAVFIVLAIVYLLCLRQVSIYLAKKINRAGERSDGQT
jgi:hypothetical protein